MGQLENKYWGDGIKSTIINNFIKYELINVFKMAETVRLDKKSKAQTSAVWNRYTLIHFKVIDQLKNEDGKRYLKKKH